MGPNEDLLVRCRREGTPLLERDKAVFLWQGAAPPRLVGDFNQWNYDNAIELHPAGENLWTYELELPEDAYCEYTFLNDEQKSILDPFNRRKTSDGMGGHHHFFYMPAGKPNPWVLRRWGINRGEVSQTVIEARWLLAGGKRTVHFYQPPVDTPSPLIVVWDGGDYLRRAKLTTMLDNLITENQIRPVALAMVENGGPARMMEYTCSETTLWFVLTRLLPAAFERLNLVDPDSAPGAFGVLGASMGGLMALYTGLRLPHIFGKVLAQSGAYESEAFEFITSFMVEHGPRPPLKIWMAAGIFEDLLESNRKMAAKLAEHDYAVDYHEFPAGHNYPAWRDDLPGGLRALFS